MKRLDDAALGTTAAPAVPGETRLAMAPTVLRWLTVKRQRYSKSGKIFGIKDQRDRILDRFGVPHAHAALSIAPGLTIGPVKARPAQTVGGLTFMKTTIDALPPRVASEVLRDVATLA